MAGLDDYASPILRASVFRRLNPGAQISYTVVPIGQAFPLGHHEYEGKATEAVRCEIVLADGTFVVAHKEIDKKDRGKDVAQTPEQMAKDETKALGRALRDLGIPQRLSELKLVMQWIASMDGNVSRQTNTVPDQGVRPKTVTETIEAVFGDTTEEEDSADAGADEPTLEQIVAKQFALLEGPDKAAVVKYAREELGCSNVMRSGEHADALSVYIAKRAWASEVPGVTDEMRAAAEATDAKHEARRYQSPPLPDEEAF